MADEKKVLTPEQIDEILIELFYDSNKYEIDNSQKRIDLIREYGNQQYKQGQNDRIKLDEDWD